MCQPLPLREDSQVRLAMKLKKNQKFFHKLIETVKDYFALVFTTVFGWRLFS